MKRLLAVILSVSLLFITSCEVQEETRDIMTKSPSAPVPSSQMPAPVPESTAQQPSGETEESRVDAEPETRYTSGDLVTDSVSYAVIDENADMWLSKDPFLHRAPASITKVLTALVVVEHVGLDEDVRIQASDFDTITVMSSGVYPSLKPEEELTVRELLYLLILASTNSAANVLARYTAGSIEAFAGMMNERAAKLGLTHSHFMNPHGLDERNHYSCAYDMAVILREALQNESLRTILSEKSYVIAPTEYTEYRTVTMGHQMVTGSFYEPGVFAGKPGGTPDAGSTLLTAVERNGKTFYICTMGSDESLQYTDTSNLIKASYGLYRGTESTYSTLLHNLTVAAEDASGATFSFDLDHGFSGARAVYWNYDIGTGQATFLTLDPQPGRNSFTAALSAAGTYVVQVFATTEEGEEIVIVQSYLFTGYKKSDELVQFNGNLYYVNANGFLKTSAVETKDGCYYAAADGVIQKGFVGGRFYAGSDGRIVTGWFTDSGARYYAQQDGRIATGHIVIDGVRCSFNEAGVLLN